MSKVLRLGKVTYSQELWKEVSKLAEVVDCESKNREEFISDLKGKYKDITNIYRTFESVDITGRFDEELSQYLPKSLKSISHLGAGVDQIDIPPLTKLNIKVSNVTVPVESPTADTAMFLLLGAMRKYQLGLQIVTNGEWENTKSLPIGNLPQDKVVGILGMGGIGRSIRDRLKPFGFKKIVYNNRSRLSSELEKDTEYVEFDQLLKSDILILALPLNPKTKHIINEETISKMKDGIILINIARGGLIDEIKLPKYLKNGKIKSFGADVFENEPKISPDLYNLPNTICTPHMGTKSTEAMANMENWTVENILSILKTNKLKSIVPEQSDLNK